MNQSNRKYRQEDTPVTGVRIVVIVTATVLMILYGAKYGYPYTEFCKKRNDEVVALEFVEYIPSDLELKWWEQREAYASDPSRICEDLEMYSTYLFSWINSTGRRGTSQDGVFSHLLYRKGDGEEYRRVIEPIVGHFRHPFGLEHCKPSSAPAVDVQDRSYIAFGGLDDLDQAVYPGKKYLFDLGTADFASSLSYLISTYDKINISFDRIWAWEAQSRPQYWQAVPSDVQGRLHFYNQGISADVHSSSHPLQILESIYMPGDYVVFKLDIDNSNLEMTVMEEIRNNKKWGKMISEMMFEMHYDSRDMQRYFGSPNMSYVEVLETFRHFREIGIFLHYWP